jgi:hemolysin-activating ACP:hemolysin acyltransferase
MPTASEQVAIDRESTGSGLRVIQPRDPRVALGMAVSYLMTDPVFARLPFGQWSRVLAGKINRGHCLFVLDGEKVVGFVGWALATQERAEAWLTQNRDFSSQDGATGEIILVNAWKAGSPAANRALVEAFRVVIRDRKKVYARRFYPDGTVRPVRMSVNEFVAGHIRRSAETTHRERSTAANEILAARADTLLQGGK